MLLFVVVCLHTGLLVDFLMHVLLRYFETTGTTRHEKVKETLETMGASILLGGLTTFIGVIPLAFSTTTIFMVVFKSFLAMACLGCGVGLILLPVLLSMVGPIVTTQHMKEQRIEEDTAKDAGQSTAYDSIEANLQGLVPNPTKEFDSSSNAGDKQEQAEEKEKELRLVMTSSNGDGFEHVGHFGDV